MKKYEAIKTFAAKQGIDFYPAGRGIGHQIMCEEGYAFPGRVPVTQIKEIKTQREETGKSKRWRIQYKIKRKGRGEEVQEREE